MADFAGKVHATDCFNGNLSLPPSGGGRLGRGGFASLNKIKFVCPVEPPSPQFSPAGRERERVAGKNEVD